MNDKKAVQLLQLLVLSDIGYPQHAKALAAFSEPLLNPQQQGELARQTLTAIAEQNLQQAEAIQVYLDNPAPQRFDGGVTVFSLAAVCICYAPM